MENSKVDYLKAFNCTRCLIPMIIIDIVIVNFIDTVFTRRFVYECWLDFSCSAIKLV